MKSKTMIAHVYVVVDKLGDIVKTRVITPQGSFYDYTPIFKYNTNSADNTACRSCFDYSTYDNLVLKTSIKSCTRRAKLFDKSQGYIAVQVATIKIERSKWKGVLDHT